MAYLREENLVFHSVEVNCEQAWLEGGAECISLLSAHTQTEEKRQLG